MQRTCVACVLEPIKLARLAACVAALVSAMAVQAVGALCGAEATRGTQKFAWRPNSGPTCSQDMPRGSGPAREVATRMLCNERCGGAECRCKCSAHPGNHVG
jgi:hypothetical protein